MVPKKEKAEQELRMGGPWAEEENKRREKEEMWSGNRDVPCL